MGNIQFRNNKILFVENKIAFGSACCCPLCPHCADGFTEVGDLTVSLPPLLNQNCDECADFGDAPFVLPFIGITAGRCTWTLDVDICTNASVDAFLAEISSDFVITVRTFFPAGANIIWAKNYGTTKPECTDLLNEEIPFSSQSPDECNLLGPSTPSAFITL